MNTTVQERQIIAMLQERKNCYRNYTEWLASNADTINKNQWKFLRVITEFIRDHGFVCRFPFFCNGKKNRTSKARYIVVVNNMQIDIYSYKFENARFIALNYVFNQIENSIIENEKERH